MATRHLVGALSALSVLLASSAGSSAPAPELSGTYAGLAQGTQARTPFSATITFTLSQNGSSVSGTWISSAGASGSVAGTSNGSRASFNFVQSSPCPGTFVATANVQQSAARLSGTYSGTGCGQLVSATFVVNKI